MLKIKDNVDLKELEKFGFVNEKFAYVKSSFNNLVTIYDDKIIDFRVMSSMHNDIDIIYDLIKADLVEKVDD